MSIHFIGYYRQALVHLIGIYAYIDSLIAQSHQLPTTYDQKVADHERPPKTIDDHGPPPKNVAVTLVLVGD